MEEKNQNNDDSGFDLRDGRDTGTRISDRVCRIRWTVVALTENRLANSAWGAAK